MIAMYRSRTGWRWRIHHRNGRVIGASTEAYVRRGDCLRNLRTITGRNVDIDRRERRIAFRWTFPAGLRMP